MDKRGKRSRRVEVLLGLGVLLLAGCLHPVEEGEAVASDWRLVWSDEFDYSGLPDPEKWTYAVGGHGWGNQELQYYTENRLENARVEAGHLVITARREEWEGNRYTSARVISRGRGDFLHGRFEIRAKLPGARGTWPAIWMMPSDWEFGQGGWPDIGEIDIVEHVGTEPGVIHASAHSRDYQWQKGTQKTGTIRVETATTAFHTYSLEWTGDYLRAFVDDVLFFEYENEGLGWTKWPYNKPFYLIMNIAVGGAWGGMEGVAEAAFPQELVIDYVRVYSRS